MTVSDSRGALPVAGGEAEGAATSDQDHGLPRFFFAGAGALIIAAIHGLLMRLPVFAEWIRNAGYGGHMITNLALSHITIVGAGTISLTGLMYYILPRLGHRPLYSRALSNVSFWFTVVGVFSFYLAVLAIGFYEGLMVHAGWNYQAAREFMGAWHKAPIAVAAAIMGIGYWTFVVNVWVSAARINRLRKQSPAQGAGPVEWLLVRFCVVSATCLFIGTVQGVYQVLPWSLDWLLKAGHPGELIDPMAHTHMNLVGGVTVGMMALLYYFLPRMLGRPIYSFKLARFSYMAVVSGVFAFYISAITLGFVEGTPVVEGRMSEAQARAMVGLWHTIPLVVAALIMGVGFWSFIANIFLTIRQGRSAAAPADGWPVRFVGLSVLALLLGTIQGVLQTLPPIHDWLQGAQGTGWMVMPFAHAQLNMVGFAILGLLTLTTFALPRVTGRPLYSPTLARRALALLAAGVALTYLIYLGLGLIETSAVYSVYGPGAAMQMRGVMDEYLPPAMAAVARAAVGGAAVHDALVLLAALTLGSGYLLFMRHIYRSIGPENVREYWRSFRARFVNAAQQHARPHSSALPAEPGEAPRRALQLACCETVGGWLGFMGMGWLISGRGFIGVMVLAAWASVYWSTLFILLAVTAAGPGGIAFMLVTWITLPLLSGLVCGRTYMGRVRELAAAPPEDESAAPGRRA